MRLHVESTTASVTCSERSTATSRCGAGLRVEGDGLEQGQGGTVVRQAEDDEAHDGHNLRYGDLLPVEGEDLQLGRQVDLAHDDAVGHREHGGGEVEHRAHPGGDQVVAGLLGTLGRGGDDADGQAVVGDQRGQVAHRAHPLAGDPLADDARVAVEQRDDPEAPLGEAAVGGQRPAQVAHPDDGDGPLLGEARGPR